jgi:hypothetical protein
MTKEQMEQEAMRLADAGKTNQEIYQTLGWGFDITLDYDTHKAIKARRIPNSRYWYN